MAHEVQLVLGNMTSPMDSRAITPVGWVLPPDLTEPQWQECGKLLQRIDGARQWWIGDWWNAGVKWGEGKTTCEALGPGFEYGTVRNCGSIAGKIELSRRRDNLTYGHHVEVCSLDDPAVQDRFLAWCEAPLADGGEVKSIRALRLAIKEHLEMRDWPEDQRERRRFVTELGYPTLANKSRDEQLIKWAKFAGCHVYIGRGSPWGNPFEMPKDGDRTYVIESFGQHYLPRKPSLLEDLDSLKGKVLECYCYPEPCHGEVLIEMISREAWDVLDKLRAEAAEELEPGSDLYAPR
jgi:hypothetical protein